MGLCFYSTFFQADDLSESENIEETLDHIISKTLDITGDNSFGTDGDDIDGVVDIAEKVVQAVIEENIDYDNPVIDVSFFLYFDLEKL